jgi:hypothetical protein
MAPGHEHEPDPRPDFDRQPEQNMPVAPGNTSLPGESSDNTPDHHGEGRPAVPHRGPHSRKRPSNGLPALPIRRRCGDFADAPDLQRHVEHSLRRLRRGDAVPYVELDLHLAGLAPQDIRAVLWSAIDQHWHEKHAVRARQLADAYQRLRGGSTPDLVEGRLLESGLESRDAHRLVNEAAKIIEREDRKVAANHHRAKLQRFFFTVPDWVVVMLYSILLAGLTAKLSHRARLHPSFIHAALFVPVVALKAVIQLREEDETPQFA